MVAELLRSVTALNAVIHGCVLGQVAELSPTRRTSRKDCAAIRAIVELEIAQNRTMLEVLEQDSRAPADTLSLEMTYRWASFPRLSAQRISQIVRSSLLASSKPKCVLR